MCSSQLLFCGKPVDFLWIHGRCKLSPKQGQNSLPPWVEYNHQASPGHNNTIIPWANDCPLVWDATVWDSFAPSYIQFALSASAAGLVAERAARRKWGVYKELSVNHTSFQ